jgi:hypothetical protein
VDSGGFFMLESASMINRLFVGFYFYFPCHLAEGTG